MELPRWRRDVRAKPGGRVYSHRELAGTGGGCLAFFRIFFLRSHGRCPEKRSSWPGSGRNGPHVKQNGKTSDSFSAELAGDFMFWPTGGHRFGWYLEPAYDYSFAGSHPGSIGHVGGFAHRHSMNCVALSSDPFGSKAFHESKGLMSEQLLRKRSYAMNSTALRDFE